MTILLPWLKAWEKPARLLTRATLLTWLIFAAGCRQRDTITLAFPMDSAVASGIPLLNNGVAIGRMHTLKIMHNRLIAQVEIYHRIKIARGSTFNLHSSLSGSQSIVLELAGQQSSLTPADTILVDVPSRKVGLQDSLRNSKAQKALAKILEGFHELIAPDSLSMNSTSVK